MYKKYIELGKLGLEFLKKLNSIINKVEKTKDIMSESGVSKEIAKNDIKSDIKRRVFGRHRRPS